MGATRPPLDYLATCSQMALESVELSRLNQASNLRKELRQLLEEWIESEVDARFARSLLEWKRAQSSGMDTPSPKSQNAGAFEQMAVSFLPLPLEESCEPVAANDSLPARPNQSALSAFEAPIDRDRSSGDARRKLKVRGLSEADCSAQRSFRSAAKEDAEIPESASGLVGTLAECSASLAKIAAVALGELERLAQCHGKASCGSLADATAQSSTPPQSNTASPQLSREEEARDVAFLLAARKEVPDELGLEGLPLFRSAALLREVPVEALCSAQDRSPDAIEIVEAPDPSSAQDNLVQVFPEERASALACLMRPGQDARLPLSIAAVYLPTPRHSPERGPASL